MKLTLEYFSHLSTAEQVIEFKKNFGLFVRTPANSPYYDILQKSLMCDVYDIPARYKIFPRTEASGFLLYSMNAFAKLVDSFNIKNQEDGWPSYFLCFMANRYKNYKRKIDLSNYRENIIINNHVTYEYSIKQKDQDEEYASDAVLEDPESNSAELKLTFVLQKSFRIRKKLFIFILSCAPSLSDHEILLLCSKFFIDFSETMELVNRLVSEKDRERIIRRKSTITSRRNFNYNQCLLYDYRYSTHFSFHSDDVDTLNEIIQRRNLNISRMNERNYELKHIFYRINERMLASLLKMARGTVSSSVFFIKKLLLWCIDSESCPLSQKLEKKLESNRWITELSEMPPLSLFKPMEAFDLVS